MPRIVRTFQPQGSNLQARLAGTPLASFRRRAIAIFIDGCLLALLVAVLAVLIGGGAKLESKRLDISLEMGGVGVAVITVLYFALSMWIGRGRTIGKRICGVRVVSLVHERLSLWHCVERSLGYSASWLEGGFGFLQYFKHVNAQTVHDRIAETIVVSEPNKQKGRA